ncbi:MAG: hypothetical protein VKI81_07975 [Synechococcaceae cyanobacterium]|nr:hypothetical protein [Synechococcaceae cyanobacterium]
MPEPSTPRISLDELQSLYEDPDTPASALEDYLLAAPEKSRPFEPAIVPDPARVETGIPGDDTQVRAALVGALVLAWERERRRRRFERDLSRRPDRPVLYFEGDSWLQFPVFVEELYDHLREPYNVLCTSKAGDTIENMIHRRPEYLRNLQELIRWRRLEVRGFVFSGAGNDVVGEGAGGTPALQTIVKDHDPNEPPEWHVDTPEADAILRYIADSYRTLFATVEERFPRSTYPQLKIYLHGYDYVRVRSLPDGDPQPMPWAAEWTGGPLRAKGFTDNDRGSAVIRVLIDRLNAVTEAVCAEHPERGVYVDLRRSVPPDQWIDELHATSSGFRSAAERFRTFLP